MPPELTLRPAIANDVATVFELIQALASYENLSHEVLGNIETLRKHLFGPRPYAEVILAEWQQEPVGFALFFHNYSSFLTRPGLYLEDLFVQPAYRGQGIGKALLRMVAQIALERGCGRLEWSVLDWNEPAIGFYQSMGATVLPDWRICRVTGRQLQALGDRHNQPMPAS